jgi:hypothetical protein
MASTHVRPRRCPYVSRSGAITQTLCGTHEPDQALIHEITRVVGRRPVPKELRRYQSLRPGSSFFLCRAAPAAAWPA